MKQNVKSTAQMVFGVLFIVFGVAGMILPVLPGWWVALIGLQLLGWIMVIDRHKPWRKIISFKHKSRDRAR